MSEWKPIETAPDDELVLLGWWVNVPDVGKWWEVEVEYPRKGPTHWMPLPTPPKDIDHE